MQIQTAEAEAPDSASVLATDEYAGQAGVFLFDPATGKRTPVAGPAFDAAEHSAAETQPTIEPEE